MPTAFDTRSWGKRKRPLSFSSTSERNSLFSTTPPLPTTPIGNVAASVERIDRIDKRCGQLVIDADRDGQEPAKPSRLERVDHPQGQHVVAIAADVGVEDQRTGSAARAPGTPMIKLATASTIVRRSMIAHQISRRIADEGPVRNWPR